MGCHVFAEQRRAGYGGALDVLDDELLHGV
jgi:hypothetical protein